MGAGTFSIYLKFKYYELKIIDTRIDKYGQNKRFSIISYEER